MPLLVIGRDKEFNTRIGIEEGLPEWEIQLFEQTWHELIKKQITLSRNSILLFAKQSTHAVHLDRPDIVVNGILKVIKQTSY
ncbi:hypothetical protein [Paenisporosarcina sp. TG20]|uniref:hypothetical protein n=1 Tax=Paenisporosarcina sp. TG20 TaxID=1211706 RepID=UPI0002F4BF93|nr:hypothetical protein [Paenisporosarcina sp. TG20]